MTAQAAFDLENLFPESELDSELAVTVPRPARACYELFADVERLPEWMPMIRSVRVLDRDKFERPGQVTFTATLPRATLTYRLRYFFSERDLSMRWTTLPDSGIRISGCVSFTPLGESACLMRYAIDSDFTSAGVELGSTCFDRRPTAIIAEFRDFAQRSIPRWAGDSLVRAVR